MTSLLINGNEGTGSVADRTVETSKQETTGGVGVRTNYGVAFADNELKHDTVCFKGNDQNKKSNTGVIVAGSVLGVGVLTVLLAMLHKHVPKMEDGKLKDFVKKLDCVTKPCYEGWSWIKGHSYDKIFKKGDK